MDPDATWYGGKRGPGDVVLDGSQLPRKGAQPPSFSGQTAGWMKTPFGTEVDLGPGHILLDGVPALRERGTAPPPSFRPVYCGHPRSPISATAELLFLF